MDPETTSAHAPVLLAEVIEWLNPDVGQFIVDGTAGAGGHSRAIAERVGSSGMVVGVDRDPEMLKIATARLAGLPATFVHGSYDEIGEILASMGREFADGILLDLGLSSDQIQWAHRGFSFRLDGPLDMRFDPGSAVSAADLVARLSAEELADVFYEFGEERASRRIARRIVDERRLRPIARTEQLAEIVRRALGGRRGGIDPATRVFQSLRIAVNGELERLDRFLASAADWIRPGGRLAIISFHSLEDRRVKWSFRGDARWRILTPKPVVASESETDQNPRARSAKLRVAERCLTNRPNPARQTRARRPS
jgi:16S rRNA (cytosine1402-N4)-methyltransferase